MTITDFLYAIGGIIAFAVNAYLLYRANQIFNHQNRLMERQNEILAHQEGITVDNPPARTLHFKQYWPISAMLLLSLLTWSAVGYDIYDRHASLYAQRFDWKTALTEVHGQTFVNEKVEIDGKNFIDCNFRNVTLFFNGTKPFGLSHNDFYEPVQFSTDSDSVYGTVALLKGMGVLKPGFVITMNHRPVPTIQPPTQSTN